MVKVEIGAGWNAFKHRWDGIDEPLCNVWSKLMQHPLIYNDDIRDYYYRQIEKEPGLQKDWYREKFDKYFGQFGNLSTRVNIVPAQNGVKEKDIFSYYLGKKTPKPYYIYSEDDLYCKSSSAIRKDINKLDLDDKEDFLALQCVDNEFTFYNGDSANKLLVLLDYMLRDEKKICFVDPFILENDRNTTSFMRTFFSKVSSRAVVTICVKSGNISNSSAECLLNEAERRSIALTIKAADYSTGHDRFIITESREMNIGAGMNFCRYDSQGNAIIPAVTDESYKRNREGMASAEKHAGVIIGCYKNGYIYDVDGTRLEKCRD